MTEVVVQTPLGGMPAYVATPASDGPWPGIVIVHDFTGMSHDLRNQAEWLASHDYLAIAPDLYHWGSRLSCLRTIMRDIGAQKGRTFDDIDAARRWLADHDDCTGSIGVVGFCMGASYAVLLAPDHGYAAASVNYGSLPQGPVDYLRRACPMVGSYGGKDRSPMGRRAAVQLDRVLTEVGVDHDIKVYPDAGHGFMNDHDPSDMTPLLNVLNKVSGTRFDAPAAADARQRIIAFFDQHLHGTQTESGTASEPGP